MVYKCKNCGKFVAKDATTCKHCGQEVPAVLENKNLPTYWSERTGKTC